MANLCKIFSVVLFVLSVILTFVCENLIFLGTAVICVIIYALGSIIERLEYLNDNTVELYKLIEKLVPKEEKPEKAPLPAKVKRTEDGNWICRKCGAENNENTQFCKECGEYK